MAPKTSSSLAIAGWIAKPVMMARSSCAGRFWGSIIATSSVLSSRKRTGTAP